ncbi:MAG: winged helix-turn-helix transcriptional regulator [Candidatus Kapabacteria bacterium]|nr:winged helix-turn-helix transcriptional regulator [Ignavibacteriota bacterium]MCW5884241.1 winged helix-turn-helix transcriptional regulator [Candidatus Kapabacteria bacterium]
MITNDEKYNEKDVLIAKFAKALAHPARVQIVKFLASQKDCFCGNIVDYVPLSQSTVSQHLKELKEAGLIVGRYQPPKIYYCINKENWKIAKTLFDEIFATNIDNICTTGDDKI